MKKKLEIDDTSRFFRIANGYLYVKRWRTRLRTIWFWPLVAGFIYMASRNTIENYRLAINGKFSKGIVLSREKAGGKGTVYIEYKFEVDSKEFMGRTNNEEYGKGDSLFILYIEKKPEINRPYTFIKRYYNTQIIPE